MDRDAVKRLKAAAWERLGGIDGVVGLGLRGEFLVVYVRDELVARQIPLMLCDRKVDVTISGDITVAAVSS